MFHKGFDFNSISQVQLDDVVNQINEMPRKILNWQKPIELFKLANDLWCRFKLKHVNLIDCIHKKMNGYFLHFI